jgi:hypothetical protein
VVLSELRSGSFLESKPDFSYHFAFPHILHAVLLFIFESQASECDLVQFQNQLVVNGRFFGGAVFQHLQAILHFVQASST